MEKKFYAVTKYAFNVSEVITITDDKNKASLLCDKYNRLNVNPGITYDVVEYNDIVGEHSEILVMNSYICKEENGDIKISKITDMTDLKRKSLFNVVSDDEGNLEVIITAIDTDVACIIAVRMFDRFREGDTI